MTDLVEEYFRIARIRHDIYHKKMAGDKWPWADSSEPPVGDSKIRPEQVFNTFKFTNVYRELDSVTIWFRENIRDPMRDDPSVLLATVLFRWFNWPPTGEALFNQQCLDLASVKGTAWEQFRQTNDVSVLQRAVSAYCGNGPYISAAYMIKSPDGMKKVPGILHSFDTFARTSSWEKMAEKCVEGKVSIEKFVAWLSGFPFQGKFTAYEVASDLRHTCVLERADDIMSWANPGPGAQRGYNRLVGKKGMKVKYTKPSRPDVLAMMRDLLKKSQDTHYWPNNDDYPPWEMREVEHWMCEFDKYLRVSSGEGYPKSNYHPPGTRRKR